MLCLKNPLTNTVGFNKVYDKGKIPTIMGQTKLTFEAGSFCLKDKQITLKAAAPLRPWADDRAEKVFKRTFNSTLKAPRLPSLSFLDDHQRDGVEWILSRKRSYLAHAPGAGKTCQFIVAACQLEHQPGVNLLIVPPTLVSHWEREIFKFSSLCSFLRPRVIVYGTTAGSTRDFTTPDFLIMPDSLLADLGALSHLHQMTVKLLGVDEASRFKETTSARSVALYGGVYRGRLYKSLVKKAGRVVFLDGSPTPNGRPMELWAPLYGLDPETIDCMDRHLFGVTYASAFQDRFGHWQYRGASNVRDLRERMRKRFMHVVGEDQLSHPERRRSILIMSKDPRTRKTKAWESDWSEGIETKAISEDVSQGDLATWRREVGLSKVAWVSDYVVDRLKNKNESILVFAWHREVVEGLAKRISKGMKEPVGLVLGGTPTKVRERIFAQFQAGECKVIVGNILAMGRGHNLQQGDRVIFAESSWSDELNKQCEKRAARRGRKVSMPVRCEYVVAPHGLEEKIMRSVFMKESRTRRLIA